MTVARVEFCSEWNQSARSEVHRDLRVNPVRVLRADGGGGKAARDVVADEEVAVADFKLRVTREGVTGDHVELRADEAVVGWIDAEIVSRRGGDAAARRACGGIKVVVYVREPEGVSLDRHAHAWMRLELEDAAHIVDVLQADEIHVAVKLVVGREQVFKSLVRVVGRIAVAGSGAILPRQARGGGRGGG